ncbi:MAG TPA: preprotein translocase subunit SecE [Candidatus Saccharimonadales bacterium]|nr:preprotein translocase subunit SecE [Candidatus Saccharimonadales bacterium]
MAEQPDKTKRRIVKKAETVREKAEKATESSKQPRRLQATKRRAGAPFRVLGKVLAKLGKFKPFRIIGLILVPPYIRNSWRELRQVTWLKPKESFRLTYAVIAFAAIFGALVALLDFGLDKVFKEVLLK